MKLCIDCTYYYRGESIIHECTHPNALTHTNLVHGFKTYRSCEVQRNVNAFCGPEAKDFEQRLTWWRKLWKTQ